MNPRSLLKYLWASPCSAVGLVLAGVLCLLGARGRVRGGVLEVAFADPNHALARSLLKLPYAGITFGHVVLAPTHHLQEALRAHWSTFVLRTPEFAFRAAGPAHERAHVAQYETWGPVLLIAYPVSSLVQVLCGRDGYADNHFEVQARALQQACAAESSRNVAPGSGEATAARAKTKRPMAKAERPSMQKGEPRDPPKARANVPGESVVP